MAEFTRNEQGQERADLAAAAVDRGMEQLENAKGQLAEGADRVAAAVERTADALDEDGEGAISGFGRSVASLTRQLAGGLRERDIEDFARELGTLARRNPGVFLAGSVALGFGMARFFKARTPSTSWSSEPSDRGDSNGLWRDGGQQYVGAQPEFDAEDGLDLSAGSPTPPASDAEESSEERSVRAEDSSDERSARAEDRSSSRPRSPGKQKAKGQRASNAGLQPSGDSDESQSADPGSATGAESQSDVTSGGKS